MYFKLTTLFLILFLNLETAFTQSLTEVLDMAQIAGTYKLGKSENFDSFLKELGVNIVMRKAATMASATVEFKVDGDNYEMKTTSTFKNSEIKFELGKEFDEDRQDGVKVKSIFTLEGDVLKQVQKGGKSGKFKILKTFIILGALEFLKLD